MAPGTRDVRLDGVALAPGTYLTRLRIGERVETGKLVRLR